jgi:hypothetical protein
LRQHLAPKQKYHHMISPTVVLVWLLPTTPESTVNVVGAQIHAVGCSICLRSRIFVSIVLRSRSLLTPGVNSLLPLSARSPQLCSYLRYQSHSRSHFPTFKSPPLSASLGAETYKPSNHSLVTPCFFITLWRQRGQSRILATVVLINGLDGPAYRLGQAGQRPEA